MTHGDPAPTALQALGEASLPSQEAALLPSGGWAFPGSYGWRPPHPCPREEPVGGWRGGRQRC